MLHPTNWRSLCEKKECLLFPCLLGRSKVFVRELVGKERGLWGGGPRGRGRGGRAVIRSVFFIFLQKSNETIRRVLIITWFSNPCYLPALTAATPWYALFEHNMASRVQHWTKRRRHTDIVIWTAETFSEFSPQTKEWQGRSRGLAVTSLLSTT